MAKRFKVLLSAYACEPGRGSEPEVGLRWATVLAQHHDVTVITRANNERPLHQILPSLPQPHPEFIFYDLPPWLVWLKRRRWLPVALYYTLWQLGVRWTLRQRLSQFDIVHHVTFNSFRQPGCWWLCPRPVVLGPLGGGQVYPWNFYSLIPENRVREFVRALTVVAAPLLPNLWLSFENAEKILVANSDTGQRIPEVFSDKIVRMLETGIPASTVTERTDYASGNRVIWVSRMDETKGPEIALRAFALARDQVPDLRLTMVGSGPCEEKMKRLAESLGISAAVQWSGRVPHAQVSQLLRQHDLFLFTSLRDTSGNVLLESMAVGLPSVVVRHQGAAEIATDQTALRIPPTSVEQTISGFAEAILQLAASADLRATLGRAASARIAEVYDWERKALQMSAVYEAASKGLRR